MICTKTYQNFEEINYNGQRYLKLTIFHMFEHFLMPTKITRQNKNWARSCMWDCYDFIQF